MEKSIVLVGLMGCGKSRVGAELAKRLSLPFVDADKEIEKAAGMSIPDIFEKFGEPWFRDGERKVMLRLLEGKRVVVASGGGAFIQPEIRDAVKTQGRSVWLRARLDTLVERVGRTDNRPLLRGVDPSVKLQSLMDTRYPVYAEADITVEVDGETAHDVAMRIEEEIGRME
jgi:shikimate kinase